MWIRTCQSCGHKQVAKPPAEYKDDRWRDLKCRKCGSTDFDYGQNRDDPEPTDREVWQ